jgi:1-deoxy-D-xylulose-5-phosphate reductoisomerase
VEKKKSIALLGATGHLGIELLQTLAAFPERFAVEVLTGSTNGTLLIEQAKRFLPNVVVVGKDQLFDEVSNALTPLDIKVYAGEAAILQVLEMDTIDLMVNAIDGFFGIEASLAAIQSKKAVAIGNRDSMVSAGALLRKTALAHHVPIFPLHPVTSATFQSVNGEAYNAIEKIVLTSKNGLASHTEQPNQFDFANTTPTMVDGFTLMDAGWNLIETAHFHHLAPEQMDLMIHPEGILQAMVQFEDGSQKAMLRPASFSTTLLYALNYPLRIPFGNTRPYPLQCSSWHFEEPDTEKFPCLQLAIDALKIGGNIPCALFTAHRLAVHAYLAQAIPLDEIANINSKCMYAVQLIPNPSLEQLKQTANEVTLLAKSLLPKCNQKNEAFPS